MSEEKEVTIEETTETTDTKTEESPVAEAVKQEVAPISVTAPETDETPAMDEKEIENGKTFAILSYVLGFLGIPFFLVPLIMRDTEFSLYHSKQCLMIWLVGIVGGTISGILALICIGILTAIALGIFILVVEIIGLMNSTKGLAQPLPLIGKYAEEWFKGISKA